jgi:hypothetical protein
MPNVAFFESYVESRSKMMKITILRGHKCKRDIRGSMKLGGQMERVHGEYSGSKYVTYICMKTA